MSKTFDLKNPQHFAMYLMESVDGQYMQLVEAIQNSGTLEFDKNRTEDTWQTLIGCAMQLHNTALAFPALLSKRVAVMPAVDETCWFARGETNIKTLNSKIWNEWADADGECGPIYGEMWRRWPDVKVLDVPEPGDMPASMQRVYDEAERMRRAGYRETKLPDGRTLFEGEIDQLLNALNAVCAHSRSRRIKVETYNPGYIHMQALPPCHTNFEFNVTQATNYERMVAGAAGLPVYDNTLHLTATMRSNDVLLGRPFNIIGYATLLHLFAKYAKLNIGGFTLNTTNTHVYSHHWDALRQQQAQYQELLEEVRQTGHPMTYPQMIISDRIHDMQPKELLDNLSADMFNLVGYQPKPAVKGRVTK